MAAAHVRYHRAPALEWWLVDLVDHVSKRPVVQWVYNVMLRHPLGLLHRRMELVKRLVRARLLEYES